MTRKKLNLTPEGCAHGGVYAIQARNITGVGICFREINGHVFFYGLREKFGNAFVTTEHGFGDCRAACGGGQAWPYARLPEVLFEDDLSSPEKLEALLWTFQDKYIQVNA